MFTDDEKKVSKNFEATLILYIETNQKRPPATSIPLPGIDRKDIDFPWGIGVLAIVLLAMIYFLVK